mmetsp:Transcript_148/g.206  ORF Transcript_148/g.206 Transcript_148/m.206 type:complete len:256 (-) Transcript_148:703-1470(-)
MSPCSSCSASFQNGLIRECIHQFLRSLSEAFSTYFFAYFVLLFLKGSSPSPNPNLSRSSLADTAAGSSSTKCFKMYERSACSICLSKPSDSLIVDSRLFSRITSFGAVASPNRFNCISASLHISRHAATFALQSPLFNALSISIAQSDKLGYMFVFESPLLSKSLYFSFSRSSRNFLRNCAERSRIQRLLIIFRYFSIIKSAPNSFSASIASRLRWECSEVDSDEDAISFILALWASLPLFFLLLVPLLSLRTFR